MADETTLTGTETTQDAPATGGDLSGKERLTRLALALVVAFGIVAAAWFVGERQGWTEIGQSGVNAKLLPKVGEPAPELFTMSTDGQPVLLSRLQGQPVWINFWGSWCPPCRAEMPDIQQAYETLSPQGVVVLSIAMREAPEDSLRYRDSVGATFPVYIDPNRLTSMIDPEEQPDLAAQLARMTQEWQIANFPTHIFIDRDGIIREIILAQMTYEEAVAHGEAILETVAAVLPAPAVVRESA